MMRKNIIRKPKRPVIERDTVIEYKSLEVLERCITPQGQLLSRRRTGLNAKRQRELKKAVKQARHVGLLPFVG
ncbi:MAG: small subunit ribosomal protein S18 [Planctomycetota bacterium]|jgi:small subunit ribosomal protein S18